MLVAAFVVAAAVTVFFAVADEVLEGEADPIDRRILQALRSESDPSLPIGPAWLATAAQELTALGSTSVLTLLTAAVAGFLWLRGARRSALFIALAVGGGALLSTLLKLAFGRDRPDVVPHLTHFGSASFPSGHAMLSTVTFLTLGVLLAEIQQRKRLRAYAIGVAATLAALVGATRVYLGVHYPSDVAAGWTAGVGWAMGCWAVARWLRRRGGIESADSPGVPQPSSTYPRNP